MDRTGAAGACSSSGVAAAGPIPTRAARRNTALRPVHASSTILPRRPPPGGPAAGRYRPDDPRQAAAQTVDHGVGALGGDDRAKTVRLGSSPSSRATAAIASLRDSPAASRVGDRGRRGRRPAPARRAAPAHRPTTSVISPRTSPGGPRRQLAERRRAGPPRRSWSVRGTRPPRRSAPNAAARSARHRGQPVRRLEEHHRAPLVGQRGEGPAPLARLARQEALEAEPVHRQPADRRARSSPPTARAARSPRCPASIAAATSR